MRAWGPLVSGAFAAILVGCGVATTSGPAQPRARAVAFTECLRTHGLPTFPDPDSRGRVMIPASISPQSAAFRNAAGACQRYWPTARDNTKPSDAVRERFLRFSECMRAHGLTGFPDPSLFPPTAPSPPGGIQFGHDGVYLIVPPRYGPASAAYQRATEHCRLPA